MSECDDESSCHCDPREMHVSYVDRLISFNLYFVLMSVA